jgi:hypothetical protein
VFDDFGFSHRVYVSGESIEFSGDVNSHWVSTFRTWRVGLILCHLPCGA